MVMLNLGGQSFPSCHIHIHVHSITPTSTFFLCNIQYQSNDYFTTFILSLAQTILTTHSDDIGFEREYFCACVQGT